MEVKAFLEDLRGCCVNLVIESAIELGFARRFCKSRFMTFDAVIRNPEVIGETIKKMPEECEPTIQVRQIIATP